MYTKIEMPRERKKLLMHTLRNIKYTKLEITHKEHNQKENTKK